MRWTLGATREAANVLGKGGVDDEKRSLELTARQHVDQDVIQDKSRHHTLISTLLLHSYPVCASTLVHLAHLPVTLLLLWVQLEPAFPPQRAHFACQRPTLHHVCFDDSFRLSRGGGEGGGGGPKLRYTMRAVNTQH